MANNATSRAAFINSSIEVARKYNFDGLDLGWEFPNTKEDMSSLSLLFEEWYNAIEYESLSGQPRLLLAAGVYFAPSFFLSDVYREYPTDAICKYVDFLNVMCFDYHGKWNTSVTAEHALLYDKSTNISTSYGISSWIEAGVPAEKLVMGLPLYGRTWQLLDPEVHGIGAPAVGVGPGEDGFMPYIDIIDFNSANAAPEVYDEETVSTYSYSGTNWIGYDGVKSIREKVKFANDQGLAGYFIWSLGYDNNWNLSTEEYKVHSYNRNGLCAVGFMDDPYPVRSAFSVLNQDPAEADKLLKIQRELDETKIILHKTIDSVLARGEKLDSLVEKSSDLSAASQLREVFKSSKCYVHILRNVFDYYVVINAEASEELVKSLTRGRMQELFDCS
ncbi:hypothetical protein GH714_011536 [Hevea brasiliensis]|uniref:GH18 domain-containing protein n=1 Tax=Hevea brasiliensis TaxID=3981 RepID=A0A6A6MV71_HEVBR|nr:hypothetical protein GH714_011536 [Hevea brasiliensis]